MEGLTLFCVSFLVYCSVVTKRELSNTIKTKPSVDNTKRRASRPDGLEGRFFLLYSRAGCTKGRSGSLHNTGSHGGLADYTFDLGQTDRRAAH